MVLQLVVGCGSGKDEKTADCPNGTYFAQSTDSLSLPADADAGTLGPIGPNYTLGTFPILFAPVTAVVNDAAGNPRNNVCIVFYTTGIWYTDATYNPASTIGGVGPMNTITTKTDNSGKVTLYWSTGFLPFSNPVSGGTTTADGADKTGTDWVQAYSGVQSKTFNAKWKVVGCKQTNVQPCP